MFKFIDESSLEVYVITFNSFLYLCKGFEGNTCYLDIDGFTTILSAN
jgi:hypothetical protein